MKKYTKIILITVIAVVLIVSAGMYLVGKLCFTDKRIYEKNWDMNIPSNAKQLYSKATPTSFHGDGFRYTIFDFDTSQSDFINEFSDQKDSDMENKVNYILSELDVEDENRPKFEHNYLWTLKIKGYNDDLSSLHAENENESDPKNRLKKLYIDSLYIIYDNNNLKLYFVQELI